ncbi:uncharacterized protein EV154DRAFT_486730 [Mucor mucedo]|uniref:uncharacterized protein n=1 Tax=Mucor mucedo TaxID=29922 RepID=UPI002220F06F|nr:uncharacterized protein EV154DRAFT_486730 [Mucor mucedo]KAI7875436.1 hypothetical protein EV154DRAFT_486730 [Mucor mucedo]
MCKALLMQLHQFTQMRNQAVSEQCWQDFTILWSRECNKGITKNIFYKLPENLRQYFKERENQSRYFNSVLLNKETVDTATELIRKSQQKISLGKATDFLQFPNQTFRDDTNQIHMKNSTPSSPRYKKTSMLLKPRTQKSMVPYFLLPPPSSVPSNFMPQKLMPQNSMLQNLMLPNSMPPNYTPPNFMPPNFTLPNYMPPKPMPPNSMPEKNMSETPTVMILLHFMPQICNMSNQLSDSIFIIDLSAL